MGVAIKIRFKWKGKVRGFRRGGGEKGRSNLLRLFSRISMGEGRGNPSAVLGIFQSLEVGGVVLMLEWFCRVKRGEKEEGRKGK